MKPQRPYLIRALYDWISESDTTPYLLVNVDGPDVQVPMDYVSNGQIVLNVSVRAVRNFHIGDEYLSFDGRFDGHSVDVMVPLRAVAAIYAKENGQGMMFDTPSTAGSGEAAGQSQIAAPEDSSVAPAETSVDTKLVGERITLEATEVGDDQADGKPSAPSGTGPNGAPRRGSHLKVVK